MIEHDFERARRKADWKRVFHFLTGKPSLLLPFDLVRTQVVVKSVSYEGIQEIDLDRVVGSVNRYQEFDREFLPRKAESGDRWSKVRQVFDSTAGFPPIKVYQVGEAFFVVDGNHRVSVARQLGMTSIEAEVIKFQPNVPITKDTDISDLIIKKEYSDFLEETHLDLLRPGQRIEFTLPGRYDVLREHIAKRRYFLGLEQNREIDYEQAVESWYDGLYRPLIEIFRQEHLLDRFHGRTEADLYVWVTQHLYFLRERFGERIGLVEAAQDFADAASKGRKLRRRVRRIAKHLPYVRGKILQSDSALYALARRTQFMERRGILSEARYRVPPCWFDELSTETDPIEVFAPRFWHSRIQAILDRDRVAPIQGTGGEWSRRAVVYNLFVRSSCAFDHNGDGRIHVLNRFGLRETGTFLKAIALLPYIQALGCNTVHLLPITRIGRDGHKGALGSPYAIANPYQVDESLAEPVVRLGPDIEFRAFVEAAHRLGMRVVLEFVFRTASKDSEWVPQHPEWFYWIRKGRTAEQSTNEGGFRSPRFSALDLDRMKTMVERGDFDGLPVPDVAYRRMYVHPPRSEAVRIEKDAYEGVTATGETARIPGAFADWPPDDAQPPWSDVTYLRLYDHPDFNYMAYNTIRMYDATLARPENEVAGLWDRIAGILPHFQDRFGIDGAMIDMGHALPSPLKKRIISGARGANPSFALWDEDFDVRHQARSEGYNAVVGNLWWSLHRFDRISAEVSKMAEEARALPALATPETHNTPRCAGRVGGTHRSACLWTLGAFLPAIPFVHSGFELGETIPVNTGLDFTDEERGLYPEGILPLYNEFAYDWGAHPGLRSTVRGTLKLRSEFEELVIDADPSTFARLVVDREDCLAYTRTDRSQSLLVVANLTSEPNVIHIHDIALADGEWMDRIAGTRARIDAGRMDCTLGAWQCAVYVPRSGTHSPGNANSGS